MAESGEFDVVLVGAGPAGCVLARRLTEDAGCRVALVEAGPDYGADPAAWPAVFRDPTVVAPDVHGWGYVQSGKPADRPLSLARARVVGGTSTINGCVWLRGSAADYDGWAALGNPGWGFTDLLPYFRRAESDPVGGPLHGTDGPVPVYRVGEGELTPLDRAMVEAAGVIGFPHIADLNDDAVQRPGIGPAPKNVADGARMNAAFTYLAPARSRPNLTLITEALVERVCLEDGRATGVRTADGRGIRGREVVLCAGAFGSPAILLRSGIGPAEELGRHGIAVVADVAGVGESLLDHPLVMGLMECAIAPGYEPGAATFIPLVLKARSRRASEEIDLHVYQGQSFDAERGVWSFWFSLSLQRAFSRGRVRLTSVDPEAPLEIDHAHVSDATDLEAMCDGVELVNRLVATPPLATALRPIPERTMRWRDRDELRGLARANPGTTFHPSGTCRMGPTSDPGAVVDREGRVYGIEGLRVADASIFPTIPRANVHCTIVAAAEKLADEIRGLAGAADGPGAGDEVD
jgi:choline dehydrogenase